MKKNITKLILINIISLSIFYSFDYFVYAQITVTRSNTGLITGITQTDEDGTTRNIELKPEEASSPAAGTVDSTKSPTSSESSISDQAEIQKEWNNAEQTASQKSSSSTVDSKDGSASSGPPKFDAPKNVNADGFSNNKDKNSSEYYNNNIYSNEALQLAVNEFNEKNPDKKIEPDEKGTIKPEDVQNVQYACGGAKTDGKFGSDSANKFGQSGCKNISGSEGGKVVKVIVTEKIPGLKCDQTGTGTGYKKTYKCTVDKGFGSVLKMLEGLVKYVTFIVILIAILMLIISGIRISIEGNKDQAKKNFQRVITGIVLLFLVGFILNSIAPWFYGG